MRRPRTVEVMLLVTILLWALNFTVTRYALTNGWNPLAYSSLRYSAGALLFAAFVAGSERSFRVGRRRDALLLGIAAVVGIFLNQVAYVYAIKLTNATTVALILGITPIFAAVAAFAVGLERLSLRFWLAALVSFAGVALVAVGAGEGGYPAVDMAEGDAVAFAARITPEWVEPFLMEGEPGLPSGRATPRPSRRGPG